MQNYHTSHILGLGAHLGNLQPSKMQVRPEGGGWPPEGGPECYGIQENHKNGQLMAVNQSDEDVE